jgi:hypothetical protein
VTDTSLSSQAAGNGPRETWSSNATHVDIPSFAGFLLDERVLIPEICVREQSGVDTRCVRATALLVRDRGRFLFITHLSTLQDSSVVLFAFSTVCLPYLMRVVGYAAPTPKHSTPPFQQAPHTGGSTNHSMCRENYDPD